MTRNDIIKKVEALTQLKNLEFDYEQQGLRDDAEAPIDWEEVESMLLQAA